VGATPSKKRHRRQPSNRFRRSAGWPLFLALALGLAAAGLTALVILICAARGGAAASSWLAATMPIASAMVGGATAGSILHWRKVCGHGAVRAGLIITAMCVLMAAQIVRFADVAAYVRADGLTALIRGTTWSAAIAVPSIPLADLARTVPGLEAVSVVVGADRVWVFVVVELALILGLAWWMAGRALAAPLCMTCRAWCVRERGVVERDGDATAPDIVRQRIAARDWSFLRDLGPARGGHSLRFDLSRCPRCDGSNAVSVMWERPLWRDLCLVGDLRLHSDDVRTLLNMVEPRVGGHLA
jgi:hypothetical protein